MSAGSLLHLQRAAGNRTVSALVQREALATTTEPRIQRVKDAFDVKLKKESLKIATSFSDKHVADDAEKAEKVTNDRYEAGKMPAAMEQGRIPNTVASADTWVGAVDDSETKVDTENDKWTKDVPVKVAKAWQVFWKPATETYSTSEATDLSLKAGGYSKATYAGKKGRAAQQVTGGSFNLDHISNG
jgi:hypothetical protein